MLYFIQVNIYTALMLLIYAVCLRNKPLHQLSRNYLLACAIVPALIPFVQLPQLVQQQMQNAIAFRVDLPEVMVNATGQHIPGAAGQLSALLLIFCAGCMLFIAWHLWNGMRLWQLISKHPKENHSNYVLIRSCGYGPGSFGKYVFFPGEELNNTVLEHEKAHISLHHSRDIVLINLLQVFMWPSLLLIWIRKELKEIHEFQADAHIDVNKHDYTQLLLGAVFNTTSIPIMHLFIIHPIKRRIMMLKKKGTASPMKAILQVASALIIFSGIVIVVQSCSKKNMVDESAEVMQQSEKMSKSYNAAGLKKTHDDNGIYTYVDKMPQPAYDFNQFLGDNIKYPADAQARKIEGRVITRFIVRENGDITDVSIVRSPDTILSNEALRVLGKMPAWNPGEQDGKKVSVYFTLPIVFKL